MPDDLDHLIDRLHALPLDLDATDIADVLWLSVTTRVGAARSPDVSGLPGQVGADQTGPDDDVAAEPAGNVNGMTERPSLSGEQDGLYDGTVTGTGRQRARRVRIRPPRALPMPLELGRSLRAFGRRWQTGRRQRFDLHASAAGYARTGHLIPIFRPAPERWFEATVLVDGSPSMSLWQDTVTAFTALLRQLGAFRSVRMLTLALDGTTPRVLNAAGRVTDPRQLRSSTARRLVLVLSDCLADAWMGPTVWQMLRDLAQSTPTALVNPLPSSLWRRTGLNLPSVRVSCRVVGGANTALHYQIPWELYDLPDERWLPLPTPALTPHTMRRWANTIMRADPVGTEAILVPTTGRIRSGARGAGAASSLESFRQVASAEAFRLAVLSSPHNPVSQQMLELLRDQLVPTATVSDMAEIIASGAATAVRDGDHVMLRIRADLRPQLQQLLSAPEAWRIHEIFTDYVAEHADTPGGLVLAIPDPTGAMRLPDHLQPFADASRSTLRLLGLDEKAPTRRVKPRPAWATLEGRDRHAACVLAAKEGDAEAFDALIADFAPLVWHIARSAGLDRTTAEDLVQTVWMALLRHLHRFTEPRALAGWLITTTRREATRVQQRIDVDQIELSPELAEQTAASDPTPENELLRVERDRALWSAFSKLSQRCQNLLRLTVLAGRAEYRAVAEALHIPYGSIGPTRGRCLNNLRALYEAELESER